MPARWMAVAVAALAAGGCHAARSSAPTRVQQCWADAPAAAVTSATAEPGDHLPGLASLDGAVVQAIHVGGAEPHLDGELEATLAVPVGEPLAVDQLRAALGRIWHLGVVDGLSVAATPVDGGVAIEVRIHPRPLIGRVAVVGADPAAVPLLRAAAGSIHDPARVERHRARSVQALHDAGYRHATVAVTSRPGRDDTVDLCVAVTRGRRYRLERIVVEGARALDPGTLRATLARPVGAINVAGGVLRDQLLAADLDRLQLAYIDAGHLAVEVGEPVATEDPGRGLVRVVIPVDEGPRYQLATVGLRGLLDGKARARRLLDRRGLTAGAWFSRRDAVLALDELRAAYPGTEVYASVELDSEGATVELTFEGSK